MVLLSVIRHDNFKSLQSAPVEIVLYFVSLNALNSLNCFLTLYKFRL